MMQFLIGLLIGFVLGVGVAIPFAIVWSRREAARVKRLEHDTRASERLVALGTLTGGLAHEIKNPLSTITMNFQLLRESMEESELDEMIKGRLRRRLDTLTGELERLRGILEDFLRFAGRMKLDRHETDVNRMIEELIDFYRPQAEASGVQLRSQLSEGVGEVELDASVFKQALLNLLINATQAMVEARYSGKGHGGSEDLIVRSGVSGDEVRIDVIDTGPGIGEENVEKIFHPYFSTRKGGTGLGLAVTRRIIEEHGGIVTVHSEVGKGTGFAIMLSRDGSE